MAGFQVTLYGRFWVTAKDFGRKAAERTAYTLEYQGKGWQDPNSNGIYAH